MRSRRARAGLLAAVALAPAMAGATEQTVGEESASDLDAELLEFLGSVDDLDAEWTEYLAQTDIAKLVKAKRNSRPKDETDED